MSTRVAPRNVRVVLDVLEYAGFLPSGWKELGQRLGVSEVDLDAINSDHIRDGVKRCLEEVISNWKRNGDYTWETLIQVVEECDKGGGYVAKKMQERALALPPVKTANVEPLSHQETSGMHHQESGDSAIWSPTSPLSPISPLSSITNRQLAEGEMFSSDEVKRIVDELNETFNNIVGRTQNALEESNANPKKVVGILTRRDAMFKYCIPRDFLRQIRDVPDVTDLFFELDGYWDYLNYSPLEWLYKQSATRSLFSDNLIPEYECLREAMEKYAADMKFFREHTDVMVFCSLPISLSDKEVPDGFKEVVRRENLRTLEDVEKCRRGIAEEYKLFECLVFIKKIEIGSVVLTFWIPSCATVDGIEIEPSDENNDGTSVDPIEIQDGVQVERCPSQEDSDKEKKAVVRKGSVTGSLLNVASRIIPGVILDPLALMLAVSNGDKKEVKSLLSRGADPNAFPPMMQFTPLMEASRTGNVEIARLLLDKGADPNLTNNEGWTAMMAAANNGRYSSVDILLQRGANPDMQDDSGWSALMATVYKRHDEIARRIIKAGATIHLQDKNHTNAILLAIATNEQAAVVEILLDRVENSSQLDLQDSYGETALIFGCKNRNLKLVERLLSMKANPNLCNNHGETPVLIATRWGDVKIVEVLLVNEADPNEGAVPPLMIANNPEVVKLLTKYGAQPYRQYESGVRPFEVAEVRNLHELAIALNPEQFSTTTPRNVLKLTLKSISTIQSHLSLGPLFLVPAKKGLPQGLGMLRGIFQRFAVH